MMTDYKKPFFIIGKTLSVLGLFYVLYMLYVEFTLDEYVDRLFEIKGVILGILTLNLFIYILGVYSWYVILLNYSKLKFNYSIAFYYYAKTDIAKYLPGNVFHLVGRQMLATKLKLKQNEMLYTSVFYSFLITVATVLIIALLSFLTPLISTTIILLMFLTLLVCLIFTYRLYPTIRIQIKIKALTALFIGYIFQSLIISMLILKQLPNTSLENLLLINIVFIFSTLIGFLTPGASGGIGVREGVFIALIAYTNINISNEIAVFTILIIRVINVLTDIIANIFTYLQKPHK